MSRVRSSPNAAALARRDERGMIGGVEVLPFGFLIFVGFAMVIANAWAVVDAKLAVEAAAREAGRAYVEAHDPEMAAAAADGAARRSIEGAGRDPDRLALGMSGGPYERCQVVDHTATYTVPSLSVPFIGSFGAGFTVTGRHRSVIDPFASGTGRDNDCGY